MKRRVRVSFGERCQHTLAHAHTPHAFSRAHSLAGAGLVPKSKLQDIHGPPTAECQQVVMLLRVLQSEVNIGYEDICGMLESFNGENVVSLAHLAFLAEQAHAGSPSVACLECMLVTGELLVLDAARCWETEEEIFATHSIPSRCSFDPTPVWLKQQANPPPPAK